MLKRNLSLVALSSVLAFPALAHEFSFGAGALDINMFDQISFTDSTLAGPTPTVVFDSTASTITGELYVGYAYNINRGFDIGLEVFYDFTGPKLQQYVADQSYIESDLSNVIGVRFVPGFNITTSTRVFV